MKIRVFFVVLSFVFIFNQVGFANGSLADSSNKAVELQKQISELMRQKKQADAKMEQLNMQYSQMRKEIIDAEIALRKGGSISDVYNKEGVDEETAALIDRCMKAEENYAKLRDELEKKLNNSPKGLKKRKMFEDAKSKIDGIKQEQLKLTKERAYVAQDVRALAKKIMQKEAELKALENKTVSAEKENASKTE